MSQTPPDSQQPEDGSPESSRKAAGRPPFIARFHDAIADIGSSAWNSLAAGAGPFLSYEFLNALESSGSVSAASGWQPRHLAVYGPRTRESAQPGNMGAAAPGPVEDSDEQFLLALLPLYIKDHSWGEYVFDWAWAHAYQEHGIAYYPKLLSAVPFTPVAGPRLLVAKSVAADPEQVQAIQRYVVQAVQREAARIKASSWHVLFPEEPQSQGLQREGLRQRMGCQFQWFNRRPRPAEQTGNGAAGARAADGFTSFDDFLSCFNSRKRKNLRREREAIKRQGISFRQLEGRDISTALWEHFYLFYQSTYLVRGQQGYLSREFFLQVGETMPDSLLLVMAEQDGRDIAGALSFRDEDHLYGRYWGSMDEFDFLHFETCYYQGIEYCIRKGLDVFDSGAQGEHKIQRGFEPVRTWSNHWIRHPDFDEAVGRFLVQEERHVEAYMEEARSLLPFKNSSG